MTDVTDADFDAAAKKVFNLQRELDITNADHIALWLEHSAPLEGNISWFACRIIEAHEIEMAKATRRRVASIAPYVEALRAIVAERERLIAAICAIEEAVGDENFEAVISAIKDATSESILCRTNPISQIDALLENG